MLVRRSMCHPQPCNRRISCLVCRSPLHIITLHIAITRPKAAHQDLLLGLMLSPWHLDTLQCCR